MLIPIVCLACGNRGKVASIPADLECVACKTGEHLDLDEGQQVTASGDDLPMALLPGGVPDQDADVALVDGERTKKVRPVPGSAPYTEQALATPVNASRTAKVAQIEAAVLAANPGMTRRTARRVAVQTVAKYPVVARTFYDRDGNPSETFVSGAPVDYSTEGTVPTPAGTLQVGQVIRSFDGMSATKTITAIEGADPFFPPDRFLVTFDDGSRITLGKDKPLYVEGSRRTAVTYGEGAHFSGSTLEQAIEAAKAGAQTQKRVVREEFWEDHVVLNKGDQGVYAAYRASAWTPHSGDSVLPFDAPPPGTIVARVSPDGQVRMVNEKVGSAHTAMPNPADLGVKVGDFFYSSWGYDQTNIDFYEVVGLTGASVKVRQVSKAYQGDRMAPQVAVVPVAGAYTSEPMTKRIQQGFSTPAFTVNSYAVATLWDGRPKYQTGTGWGH